MGKIADKAKTVIAETSDKDPRLVQLEDLARQLHAEGVEITIDRGQILPPQPKHDSTYELQLGSENHLRLGVVSDTHLGSRFEQLSALRRFYQYGTDCGVRAFLHAGDWLQGVYSKRKFTQAVHAYGADAQVAYAAAVYPKADVPTYGITGNHDDTFYIDSGANTLRQLAALREDIIYLGQDACHLTIDGLRIYLIHPEGGGSYAKTYRPQKVVEALPRDKEVQLALIGHFHNRASFDWQDMEVIMLPCFQGQYGWLVRKALYPSIGGVILDIWYDGDSITRITQEFVRYKELAHDWDEEASYQAGLKA